MKKHWTCPICKEQQVVLNSIHRRVNGHLDMDNPNFFNMICKACGWQSCEHTIKEAAIREVK